MVADLAMVSEPESVEGRPALDMAARQASVSEMALAKAAVA